jgi:signal transduction histidine kinase
MRGRLASVIGPAGSLQRRFALVAALFAVLVVAIILVFGHLVSQSLSRRYLEDLLISGREEARRVADELEAPPTETLDVVILRREELIRSALDRFDRKQVIERFEVTDAAGEVVYQADLTSEERIPRDLELPGDLEIGDDLSDSSVVETEESFQVRVPMGEVGDVVLYLSKARLAERVTRLRRELLVQTIGAATLTVATLVLAFVFVWHLVQRTRRLEVATREAEEFAALGTLAANLAHEIRNPLNSINLNLELLEEDLEAADGEARSSLASTRSEVGRLARLVSDFLTYARPSEGERRDVRIDRLLSDVREFLAAESRSMGVHLRVAPGAADSWVRCDEGQMRQVLLNLVLNAIQAVAGLEPDRRIVELDAVDRGETVAVIVRDRGEGIPQGDVDRVRQAFYTRRRGGTGLGLAIADRFVTGMGGRIELNNLDPTGFESVVVLPTTVVDGKMPG